LVWHLFAVLIMGVCAGGFMFFLRKLSRNRLPKWPISVSAAAAMFGYLAYYDYTWFEFKSGLMPSDTVIVATQNNRSFLKPWSYIKPATNVFTVFDGRSKTTVQDGETLVEYYLYTFYKDPVEGVKTRSYLMNCTRMERASFDKEKPEQMPRIEKIGHSDLMYQTLCL